MVLADPVTMDARPIDGHNRIQGILGMPIIVNYCQSLDRPRCGFTVGRPVAGDNVFNIHTRRADDHAKTDIVHKADIIGNFRDLFGNYGHPMTGKKISDMRRKLALIARDSQTLREVSFAPGKICPEPVWAGTCRGNDPDFRRVQPGGVCTRNWQCDNYGAGCRAGRCLPI
ncbi:MAG: hypothetical protein COT18_02670 [Elusimicrobia bacterium CG08_land_8_20_14_0_20_59_10]|nr:MAG: hypothetical protein COT18_02670 [Elusimicrobia bacterium CG08_land_8_20_14_0_20_59_10]